jgi:hypothetical protein
MPKAIPLQDATAVSHSVNLLRTTTSLTELADEVETWVSVGRQPSLPEALVLAAERITAAMKVCRPTKPTKQMPLAQLVISLVIPGEEVTAKELSTRLTRYGWNATNSAISVALHRASVRGIFERRRRGVYRHASAQRSPEPSNPSPPTGEPPELQEGNYCHERQAKTELETPM